MKRSEIIKLQLRVCIESANRNSKNFISYLDKAYIIENSKESIVYIQRSEMVKNELIQLMYLTHEHSQYIDSINLADNDDLTHMRCNMTAEYHNIERLFDMMCGYDHPLYQEIML